MKHNVLAIFDFDCSLVDEDSDELVYQTHYPELRVELTARWQRDTAAGTLIWSQFNDDFMHMLAEDRPHVSPDEIQKTVANIAVQERMLDALKLVADHPNGLVAIVSDANTVYIESMLDHHKLKTHVTKLETNPAHWEPHNESTQRLRVHPYHGPDREPHGCERCPANMCKGAILEALRDEHDVHQILYVGDGVGDFCPATRLSTNDIVFARADNPNGKSFALLKMLESHSDKIQAKVVPWSTGEDIFTSFEDALTQAL